MTEVTSYELYKVLEKDSLCVNSYHHQAVRELAEGLVPMATAPDGLVEAVSLDGYPFLWALQWHPEFNYKVDGDSRKIFSTFVKKAGSRT